MQATFVQYCALVICVSFNISAEIAYSVLLVSVSVSSTESKVKSLILFSLVHNVCWFAECNNNNVRGKKHQMLNFP